MKRIEAIQRIMEYVSNEIVISSCGMISREVYATRDRDKNFYNQGAMGSSLGIGIGLAISKPYEQVIVIAGDGECLMSLGTLVLMKKLDLPNLELIILDNNVYQSTGSQKTISDAIDFKKICYCKVFPVDDSKLTVSRIDISHKEITRRFMNAVKE